MAGDGRTVNHAASSRPDPHKSGENVDRSEHARSDYVNIGVRAKRAPDLNSKSGPS